MMLIGEWELRALALIAYENTRIRSFSSLMREVLVTDRSTPADPPPGAWDQRYLAFVAGERAKLEEGSGSSARA